MALYVEYGVLIYLSDKCKHALEPSALLRHLRDKHQTSTDLKKQVVQHIKGFPFAYNHASVPLPRDGSALQPVIPIVDGFACRDCPYKLNDDSNIRIHGNKAHNKKKVANGVIF
jgi:hypothetical protein